MRSAEQLDGIEQGSGKLARVDTVISEDRLLSFGEKLSVPQLLVAFKPIEFRQTLDWHLSTDRSRSA